MALSSLDTLYVNPYEFQLIFVRYLQSISMVRFIVDPDEKITFNGVGYGYSK